MSMNPEHPRQDEMLNIDDPEDLSQKKRINQILKRRENVIDARNEAIDAYLTGELQKEQAIMAYQSRIESLIIDLWTKFKKSDSENGQEILEEEHIAEVTIYPPAELQPDDASDLAAGESMPEPKTRTIYGLEWFIENKPILTAPFSVHSWNPPKTLSATGQAILDFDILDRALLKCFEFIDEAGIDADLEDDVEDAKFEYADLLDDDGDDPE